MTGAPDPEEVDHHPSAPTARGTVRLCLTGDVMCGRGVDQIQRHPGDPRLYEGWSASALSYVELAEAAGGEIPRAVDPAYVWGIAPRVVDDMAPDAVIVNLETAVTDGGAPWPDKPVHYRMHPANAAVLGAVPIDVASLANNHVLDWSRPGLEQTLDVLDGLGIRRAGAGRTRAEAWSPAVVEMSSARTSVLAVGSPTSGIPLEWAAGDTSPGVAVVPDLSERSVRMIAETVEQRTHPDDLVVLSIHWGPNWARDIPGERRRFAHDLIDRAGVDVVHGHSSHHLQGIEVHRGHLIVHGCGDLLTDYEGIAGHERYRGDLGGLWFTDVDARSGELRRLEIVPTRLRRFRLTTPPAADLDWLESSLDTRCRRLGTRLRLDPSGHLVLEW